MSFQTILTEVLCEIFHFLCEQPISLHTLENRRCFEEFPWAAGQVCRRWRETFLSYPRLWTSLSLKRLTFPGIDPKEADRFAEMDRRTVLYLERSGQLPLTLIVAISTPIMGRIHHVPRAAWRSLLSCTDRWKKVDLTLGNYPCMADDLLECRGKFSMLESISMQTDNSSECKAQDSAFAVAPRLFEVDIQYYGAHSNQWAFPWSQLTKIQLHLSEPFVSEKTFNAILSQLQNVEELRFIFYDDGGPRFSQSTSIRLPHVRFLEATSIRYPYIFQRLEIPLLEHLWVNSYYNLGSLYKHLWNVEMLSFISRSSCHIRRLTLQNCSGGLERALVGILASIECLCIKNPWQPNSATHLIRLIASSDDHVYLPNLQELQLLCCFGLIDEQIMVEISRLFEARGNESSAGPTSHRVAPLERVTVKPTWGDGCHCMDTRCGALKGMSRMEAIDIIIDTMRSWYPVADISVDRMDSTICIEPRRSC